MQPQTIAYMGIMMTVSVVAVPRSSERRRRHHLPLAPAGESAALMRVFWSVMGALLSG